MTCFHSNSNKICSFFGQTSPVCQHGEFAATQFTVTCKKKKQLDSEILSHNIQDHAYVLRLLSRVYVITNVVRSFFAHFCRHFTFVKMAVCNYEMLLFLTPTISNWSTPIQGCFAFALPYTPLYPQINLNNLYENNSICTWYSSHDLNDYSIPKVTIWIQNP